MGRLLDRHRSAVAAFTARMENGAPESSLNFNANQLRCAFFFWLSLTSLTSHRRIVRGRLMRNESAVACTAFSYGRGGGGVLMERFQTSAESGKNWVQRNGGRFEVVKV